MGSLSAWSMTSPMYWAVLIKSSDRPPSDSTTNGMNVTPTERQGCIDERRASFEYTWRAWPGVKADSSTIDCWSGEITWTSRAAGRPPCPVGRKMSAGLTYDSQLVLTYDSGIKPLVSRAGLRAADWAAENKTSRIALWRVILSPFPPQPTWWSPNSSAIVWHAGQQWGELWRGIPSQYLKQQRNSLSCMWRPRVSEGTPFSQSPACGRAVELVRAL